MASKFMWLASKRVVVLALAVASSIVMAKCGQDYGFFDGPR